MGAVLGMLDGVDVADRSVRFGLLDDHRDRVQPGCSLCVHVLGEVDLVPRAVGAGDGEAGDRPAGRHRPVRPGDRVLRPRRGDAVDVHRRGVLPHLCVHPQHRPRHHARRGVQLGAQIRPLGVLGARVVADLEQDVAGIARGGVRAAAHERVARHRNRDGIADDRRTIERSRDLERHAGDAVGTSLRRHVQACAVRTERGAGQLGSGVADEPTERRHRTVRALAHHAELHVAAVLADEHATARRVDHHVVDRVERSRRVGEAVVGDRDRRRGEFELPDPLVELRREVDDTVAEDDPFAALEDGRRRLPVGRVRRRGDPRHDAVAVERGGEERARRQVARCGRYEPVQAPLGVILRQVDIAGRRVHRGRLVVERAHRRPLDALARTLRIALPHVPARTRLLAREPGAPRGHAAGAVQVGAGEDRVGVGDRAVLAEPDRGRAPTEGRHLGVRHVDPSAVRRRDTAATVGR